MTLSNIHNLHTKSVDFVQAYSQAEVKSAIYLYPPAGLQLTHDKQDMVLKLLRNLYGLKDAGPTWFQYLSEGLESTMSDSYIFVKGTNMIVLYVDGCIILSRTKAEADEILNELNRKGYNMTDEDTMKEYMGILITHNNNGTFKMSQLFLIDRIVKAIPDIKDTRSACTPADATVVLTKDSGERSRNENWYYRSVIGMINYLVNCTHPEISFAVHQCARFCHDPKLIQEQAVKRIIRYLLSTKWVNRKTDKNNQGIIYSPDKTRNIDTYVDASFAGE